MGKQKLNNSNTPALQQTDVKSSYSEWELSIVKLMKKYPLVLNGLEILC